jgi:hypothetical protein
VGGLVRDAVGGEGSYARVYVYSVCVRACVCVCVCVCVIFLSPF